MKRFIRAARKVVESFFKISNRDRIPKLPSMLASTYDDIPDDARRVMARLGIRSPSGLRRVMRRAGVDDVNALIEALNHYKPPSRAKQRIRNWLVTATGLYKTPHRGDFKRLKQASQNVRSIHRLAEFKKAVSEKQS